MKEKCTQYLAAFKVECLEFEGNCGTQLLCLVLMPGGSAPVWGETLTKGRTFLGKEPPGKHEQPRKELWLFSKGRS